MRTLIEDCGGLFANSVCQRRSSGRKVHSCVVQLRAKPLHFSHAHIHELEIQHGLKRLSYRLCDLSIIAGRIVKPPLVIKLPSEA